MVSFVDISSLLFVLLLFDIPQTLTLLVYNCCFPLNESQAFS